MASKKLTETEKMQMWHEGTRKLNVNACSLDKLNRYYEICSKLGFNTECGILAHAIANYD